MRSSGNGQGLTEYAMIGGLILCVAIGALVLMGKNVSQIFGGMLGSHPPAAASAAPGGGPANSTAVTSGGNPTSAATTPAAAQSPASQPQTQAPSTQTASASFTSGALGTTLEQTQADANSLANMAAQLKNDPNADPAAVDLITKLANAGHQLALTETATATACGSGNCSTDQFTADYNNYESLQHQTEAFLAANPGILPANATSTIMSATTHINTLADAYVPTVNAQIDAQTHTTANTICANGGDTASCVSSP